MNSNETAGEKAEPPDEPHNCSAGLASSASHYPGFARALLADWRHTDSGDITPNLIQFSNDPAFSAGPAIRIAMPGRGLAATTVTQI